MKTILALGLPVLLIAAPVAAQQMTATPAAAQPTTKSEIGYEAGSLGFQEMMRGDWKQAEAALTASADMLGNDSARLLQLAEIYRQTGRELAAQGLYEQVLDGDDKTLVLGDGRVVTAHNIASTRLSTVQQASLD